MVMIEQKWLFVAFCIGVFIMTTIWSFDRPMYPTVANSATVDASSPTSCVIGDEVVYRGGLTFDDPCVAEPYGAFGAVENGILYPFANLPAVDPRSIIETRITHYGPPTFALDNCHTATGYTPRKALAICEAYSIEWGIPITGFCAVSRNLPWYDQIYDTPPPLIHIDGHGDYLALDHKGSADCQGVDIYEPEQESFPGGFGYCEARMTWKIK